MKGKTKDKTRGNSNQLIKPAEMTTNIFPRILLSELTGVITDRHQEDKQVIS
jgi:hypothetical protein